LHIETTVRLMEEFLHNASFPLPAHHITFAKFSCKKIATSCEKLPASKKRTLIHIERLRRFEISIWNEKMFEYVVVEGSAI
jgi:hypothetical protein